MQKLLRNIRFYILIGAVGVSLFIYALVSSTLPVGALQIVKLVQNYAYVSLILLYLALLIGPLIHVFPNIPYRQRILDSRRAIGVSMWYFAMLHGILSFFFQLGGFSGMAFLGQSYLVAIIMSLIALLILTLLAASSFDKVITYLSHKRWKRLQQTVYIVGILTLIHTFMLGTKFSDLTGVYAQALIAGIAILLMLHALASDRYLKTRKSGYPSFGPLTLGVVALIVGFMMYLILPAGNNSGGLSFGIHAAHIRLAQEAQPGGQKIGNVDVSQIPGLNGDRTKRYTMSFRADPEHPLPGQDVALHLSVNDASNGSPVTLYRVLYSKLIHLMITDNSLTYFTHIHPEQHGSEFTITTQFPKEGIYHLYTEFQPFGGIEQQIGFTLPVGTAPQAALVSISNDVLTKTFGQYEVKVDTHGALDAAKMSLGEQTISFTLRDAKTKQSIKTLHPYLASFGHLTMINVASYDFLHVHPFSPTIPKDSDLAGPTVDFLPIGIYGPFKPGIYKAFAEFNPDGTLITVDFLLNVH